MLCRFSSPPTTANAHRQQLSSASSSVVLMGAMVVHARGQYAAVQELFGGLAPALMSQVGALELVMAVGWACGGNSGTGLDWAGSDAR